MTRTALESTSAFYRTSPGLHLFRYALGTSQRLWPSLAARIACRLFCTPLPPRWLTRRAGWDPSWQIERWPFECASVTVYSQAPASQAPVALLVHGWGGHAGQMLPLAQALGQRGLHPVLVEMPAHGRSAGSVSNLPQFARAIEYVAARLLQEGRTLCTVVAHSLAANAAACAISRGVAAERLVLIAPPASPREYTRLFAQVFGLSEATRAALQQRIEAREGILMPQFEPAAVGPRIRLPTLVVHDHEDRVNPFADGMAYAQAIRGAQLVATQGLGHRKILNDAEVLGKVAIFAS